MSAPPPPPPPGNIWQSAKAIHAASKQPAAAAARHQPEMAGGFGPAEQARLHAALMRGYAPEVCITSSRAAPAVAGFPRTQMSGSDADSAASSAVAPADRALLKGSAASSAASGVGASAALSDAQSLHSSDAPPSPMPSRKRKAHQSVGQHCDRALDMQRR